MKIKLRKVPKVPVPVEIKPGRIYQSNLSGLVCLGAESPNGVLESMLVAAGTGGIIYHKKSIEWVDVTDSFILTEI